MEASIKAVEDILGYEFKDKKLIEEALTHPSHCLSKSYEQLEFVGDSALNLAITKHLYLTHPDLDQGELTELRSANVSTEKFARVAIRHELYKHIRHNVADLQDTIRQFTLAIQDEGDVAITYGGSVTAPKFLADIVESIAAAIYIDDFQFDLVKLWRLFRRLLEPIVTPADLQRQPHPVTLLFDQCHKDGNHVYIEHVKQGSKTVANVYINGELIASGSDQHKETARLYAAKKALEELSRLEPIPHEVIDVVQLQSTEGFPDHEIEGAKQKLHEFCRSKKWPNPNYKIENEDGPAHDRKFVCSVQIDGRISSIHGDVKSKVKDAENSAASILLHRLALLESNWSCL